MKYTVVIEKAPANYGAYVPDLPGCVATAKTRDGVERLIKEAIELHIEGMIEDGDPIPTPSAYATEVEVSAPDGRTRKVG